MLQSMQSVLVAEGQNRPPGRLICEMRCSRAPLDRSAAPLGPPRHDLARACVPSEQRVSAACELVSPQSSACALRSARVRGPGSAAPRLRSASTESFPSPAASSGSSSALVQPSVVASEESPCSLSCAIVSLLCQSHPFHFVNKGSIAPRRYPPAAQVTTASRVSVNPGRATNTM